MITHKVTKGLPELLLGCYESFDSANRAALEYISGMKRGFGAGAEVRTVQGALVVSYRGNSEELHADGGPATIEERKFMGWQVQSEVTDLQEMLGEQALLCRRLRIELKSLADVWQRYQRGDLSREEFEGTVAELCEAYQE